LDSTATAVLVGKYGEILTKQKIRDIFKFAKIFAWNQSVIVLVGLEEQTEIIYELPVKCLLYDALAYDDQVNSIANARRKKEKKERETKRNNTDGEEKTPSDQLDTSASEDNANTDDVANEGNIASADESSGREKTSYVSRLLKGQKLLPVYTFVLYLGEGPWDGPKTLKECLHIMENDPMAKFLPDYEVPIICPADLTDEELKLFRTGARPIIKTVRLLGNSRAIRDAFRTDADFFDLDPKTMAVIQTLTGIKVPENLTKGGVNLSTVLEAIVEDATKEAREETKEAREETKAALEETKAAREREDKLQKEIEELKRALAASQK
jgi:hypothetical protein